MQIDDAFIAAFEEGRAHTARLRELLAGGGMSDPQIAAEVVQLGESMQLNTTVALKIFHQALVGAKREPLVRKTLEAMGLTREEVKRLADACLAIYEDKPEAQT